MAPSTGLLVFLGGSRIQGEAGYTVIDRDEMFDPLLAACPSFGPAWQRFVAGWQSEEGDPPLYVALSSLCHHVIALRDAGDDDAVRRVFAVVEAWHPDGDAYVREAATIGFIETLGNILSHDPSGPARLAALRAFTGPETTRWWRKVDAFWAGNHRALSDE